MLYILQLNNPENYCTKLKSYHFLTPQEREKGHLLEVKRIWNGGSILQQSVQRLNFFALLPFHISRTFSVRATQNDQNQFRNKLSSNQNETEENGSA